MERDVEGILLEYRKIMPRAGIAEEQQPSTKA